MTGDEPPLRVEAIELRELRMPLRHPFETSFGRVDAREIVLCRLETDGPAGWGEVSCARLPRYGPETPGTAWHVLRDVCGPAVVGGTFPDEAALGEAIGPIRGHRMARAALRTAYQDALCRRAGRSLRDHLGGRAETVRVGVSVGLEPTDEEVLEQVDGHLAAGYGRVKLKIRPGRDAALCRRVREAHPDLPLAVDANGAYPPSEADALRALDDLDLLWIEQPHAPDDLLAHARLQADLETPVCLDESVESLPRLETALALGACRALNVKPARVGGLTEARRLHDACREAGIPCLVGGMLETGVGRAACVALAGLPGFSFSADLSASSRYWEADVIRTPFRLEEGSRLRVPDGPGLGVEVDEVRLEERTVRREVIR